MINESGIKADMLAAEDRGETTGLMDLLLIGETSRHRAPLTDLALEQLRNEYAQLAPSENRSKKSADGRMATGAAWLNGNRLTEEESESGFDRPRLLWLDRHRQI
jgi:hypothetical protein